MRNTQALVSVLEELYDGEMLRIAIELTQIAGDDYLTETKLIEEIIRVVNESLREKETNHEID